jgi:hypothetical protein
MLARKRSGYEGHDIHAVTGKHGDVRMVLEQSCGVIGSFRLDHEIAAEWMDAAFFSSHAAHCATPTVSIASCSALVSFRKDAKSSGFMV